MAFSSENIPGVWRKFLSLHWRATVIGLIVLALAVIGGILVYLWYVGQAQISGLVPSSLSLWSMKSLIDFLLNLAFWELLLVGIPLILAIIVAYMWYNRLPSDERDEYKRGRLFSPRSRGRDGGDWFSFLIFIAFAIKISLDGNWDKAFSTWTFDYLVYSWVVAFIGVLAVLGIPALIVGTWWLRMEIMKAH